MKIEKLTENKIRIILGSEDIKEKNIDLHTIMSKALESQGIFLEMLNKAEKEVGFQTEGHKLLIEAFSSTEGFLIFTITKYKDKLEKNKCYYNKNVKLKKKTLCFENDSIIYAFKNFEEFCSLCFSLNNNSFKNTIAKKASLYLYKDTYYLILSDINSTNPSIKKFFATLSEFGKLVGYSKTLQVKLLEHGKAIIPKNAINVGIKYFSN